MWTLRRYNNINALLSDNPDYNNYIYVLKDDKSEQILNMINNNFKCSEICDTLKISSKTYYKYIDIFGFRKIDKKSSKQINKDDMYNQILELKKIKTNKEIIIELGVSSSFYYKLLKQKK